MLSLTSGKHPPGREWRHVGSEKQRELLLLLPLLDRLLHQLQIGRLIPIGADLWKS